MDTFLDFIKAFAVGGALCAMAQILIDKTRLTPARILVFYVVLGVALTGVGVYGYVVDFAGCGATLPLTGFGYAYIQIQPQERKLISSVPLCRRPSHRA